MGQALQTLSEHMESYVHSPTQARILQLILKDGSDEQKKLIKDKLNPLIDQLLFSKYGRFVAVELLNYQSDKSTFALIKEHVAPLGHKLVTNASANIALNMIFSNCSVQLQDLIINTIVTKQASDQHDFISKQIKELPQTATLYMENLQKILVQCESKMMLGSIVVICILKAVFTIYFQLGSDNEELKKSIMASLDFLLNIEPEQFMQLIDTKEGVEVACYIYCIQSAKQKKKIM